MNDEVAKFDRMAEKLPRISYEIDGGIVKFMQFQHLFHQRFWVFAAVAGIYAAYLIIGDCARMNRN